MAHWKKLPAVTRKQDAHLQNGTQTSMDIWNRIVGLCHQIQHSDHPTISI